MDLSAIKIKVTADTNEAKSNLKSLESTGASLSSLGTKLSLGLTAPLVAFAGASVKAADALRQTQRKSEVIFGAMTKDVQDWALENERTFGLGAGTIEGYTGKIADLTQGMGLGKKESVEMAKGAMELGVQLANWNGVGADVAMEDLTRAISGSHEAVEKYGIKLNETVLNEQARKMGLGETFNKLSEAEKAQVRYNAIIEASGNAIEFWNEGNRSTAFYIGEIKEQVGNIMETIGGLFLPILDKVVKGMADWVSNIAAFLAENPKVVQGVVMLGSALALLGPGMAIVGKLMGIFAAGGAAATGLAVVGAAVGTLGIAFIGLNENAAKALLELPDKAKVAIEGFLNKVVENLPKILEKGTELIFKLIEGIAKGVPKLLQFTSDSIMNLCDLLFKFGPKFLKIGLDFVINMLNGAIKKMPEFLSKFMDGILKVLSNIRAKLPEFMKNGIEFVAKMISGISQKMPTIISKIGELLSKLISKIIEYLPKFLSEGGKIVREIMKGLWNNRGVLLNAGKDLIKGLWNSIKAACSSFVNIGKSIVDSIKQGVSNAWGGLTSWISSKVSNIPIIGKLVKGIPHVENSDSEPIPATFGLGGVARSPFAALTESFGGFEHSKKEGFRLLDKNNSTKLVENKSLNLNINIDNFNNNREMNIEQLTEEIAFNLKRKLAF